MNGKIRRANLERDSEHGSCSVCHVYWYAHVGSGCPGSRECCIDANALLDARIQKLERFVAAFDAWDAASDRLIAAKNAGDIDAEIALAPIDRAAEKAMLSARAALQGKDSE